LKINYLINHPFLIKLITLLVFILSFQCIAESVYVTDLQLSQDTRLVFNISAPAKHKIFTLKSPHRVVIDLKNTKIINKLPQPSVNHSILKSIRYALREQTDLRIVLDVKVAVRPRSFLLKPSGDYGHRLIVDIIPLTQVSPAIPQEKQDTTIPNHPTPTVQPPYQADSQSELPAIPQNFINNNNDFIIAIDAGHGGVDPGAIGQMGTHEKDVVLAIATALTYLITQTPGMRPVMIRSGDYFLSLRKRIDLAREHKADLFISIHADAYANKQYARGASVYMLSQQGASSEAAKWLAERENSADLLGGVPLNDKDPLLASVLLDLSQAGTLEASARVGQKVVAALGKTVGLHLKKVQYAAFMVLRSPDIPSILVETTFISTPEEEKKLNNPTYQQRIANALFNGIVAYFSDFSPR